MARLMMILVGLMNVSAVAATQKATTLKPRAFFQKTDSGLFESLDLKKKTIKFGKSDFEKCQNKMIRIKDTLHFSCKLELPQKSKIARRHNMITPTLMIIPFAGADRRVIVTVADDASTVTYSTEFDIVGFDLEVAKFNDDFYRIYSKTAHNILTEAMSRTLQLETLESRDTKLAN